MQKSNFIAIACGLLTLVHWAPAQAPNAPNTPAPEGVGTIQSLDPFRSVRAGEVLSVIQPEDNTTPRMISLKWEVFSLPLMDAHKFLTLFQKDSERYAEIIKRGEAGTAVLEEMQMLRTRSGQRAKVEAIVETIYPTEFLPPSQQAEPPRQMVPNPAYTPSASPPNQKANANAASAPFVPQPAAVQTVRNALSYPCPTAFETRNAGSTLEVEPTLGPDGVTIDVTVAPELVRFLGNEPHTPDKAIVQPKFQTQKMSTSFTIRSGRTFLLGTQSPSHLSGIEGANQEKVVWLSFITADAVKIE